MRILYASTLIVCAALLVGCGNRESKSGTGTGTAGGNVEYEVYPTEIIVLPGEQKEAKVSRKGTGLKDADVTVTSPDPNVTIEGGKFKGDAKEATITIKAAPGATAKEHTVTLKAGDVTKTLKVRVERAGGGDAAKKNDKAEGKSDTKADAKADTKTDEKAKIGEKE